MVTFRLCKEDPGLPAELVVGMVVQNDGFLAFLLCFFFFGFLRMKE